VPRCACGQNTCACQIIAVPEDGIEVTGVGSQSNPYRIKNLRGDTLSRVLPIDTDTVDLTYINLSPGDPNANYTLQADATMSMSDLTDVNGADVPAAGDVPTWNGTYWEFAPPATTGPSLVSGIWGVAPLDAATYGSNSLLGRETYLDSAGKARTRPEQITGLAAQFPVTALPTVYPTGNSVMYVSTTDGATWPTAGQCTVVTHKTTNNATFQLCTAATTGIGKTWMRSGTASGWSSWTELGTGASAALPSGIWGTAPLTTAIYGTDSLTGREIYVDSAGKLRSKPEQLSQAGGQYPVTALPTVYPTGHTVMYIASVDAAAWPTGASCVVTTSKAANGAAQQWCAEPNNIGARSWFRTGQSAGWSPWKELGSGAATVTELGASINLDTVTSTGFYTQSQNAETSLALNYPSINAGLLEVTVNSSVPNQMVWQRYTVYGGSSPDSGVTYTRSAYQGVWKPWVSVGYASGTWGTAPLDAYGTNTQGGREVYRDSLGQLRAKPEEIPSRAGTALPSTYPVGTSIMYVAGADSPTWPGGAIVVTHKTSNLILAQWCYLWSAVTTKSWYRNGSSTAWSPWVTVAEEPVYGWSTRTTSQSIPNGSTTTITGMTLNPISKGVTLDTGGSGLVVPSDGLYQVIGTLTFMGDPAGGGRSMFLYKGGSAYLRIVGQAGTYSPSIQGTFVHEFVAGDVLSLRAYQSSGIALGLDTNSNGVGLQLIKL
jgi:hypothetical protein